MSEWQPIETAPRDGTWFVGKARSVDIPTVVSVAGPRTDYSDLNAPPKDWDTYAKALNCGTRIWALSDFTHWMPLPEPPK